VGVASELVTRLDPGRGRLEEAVEVGEAVVAGLACYRAFLARRDLIQRKMLKPRYAAK
jgi:hypothetical protein